MTSKIEAFMREARTVAHLSEDPSTKVGAVLLDRDGQRIYGHNTFIGLSDPEGATREERYEAVVHAEEVVLLRAGTKARGATLFSTHEPCGHCYRLLIAAGVSVIVHEPTDEERRDRWKCEGGMHAAIDAGLEVTVYVA